MKLTEVRYAGLNLQEAWFVVDLEDGDIIIGPFPSRADAHKYAQTTKNKYPNRNLRFSWTKVVSPEYYDDLLTYDS